MKASYEESPRRAVPLTALSVSRPGFPRNPAWRFVARFSLFLGAVACTTGCFDAPPEYSEPTRIPPVIIASQCDPALTQRFDPAVLGNSATFKVMFHADDFGLNLRARLYRDLTLSGRPELLDDKQVVGDPRAFADQVGRYVD